MLELGKEAQALREDHRKDRHIFGVKEALTVTGLLTSELGSKEVLVYDPIPGVFSGCIDVNEVGGVWA